jgi:hypothetical protein
MAGFKLLTDLDAGKLYKVARRVARDMEFAVDTRGDYAFGAGKGNLVLSIVLGAFIAYCDFHVTVEEDDHASELIIERNNPWWTGMIGVKRTKNRAKELADAIADAIEDEGGRVLKEKEF